MVIGREGQLARALAERAGAGLNFAARPEFDLASGASLDLDGIDLVINAAAYTDVDGAEGDRDAVFAINADAPARLAAQAAAAGVGFIHISTDYVFGGNGDRPYREDDPVDPPNVYGESKLVGEQAVRAAGGKSMIIRTSWLVSPFGRNFIRTMLRLADERPDIGVVDDQVGRPTSALDLADALIAIASRWPDLEGGTYHLAGGGDPGSWADLTQVVMERRRAMCGSAPVIRRIATADFPTPAVRPAYSVLDCGKARDELGIALPDWRGSVAAIADRLLASA